MFYFTFYLAFSHISSSTKFVVKPPLFFCSVFFCILELFDYWLFTIFHIVRKSLLQWYDVFGIFQISMRLSCLQSRGVLLTDWTFRRKHGALWRWWSRRSCVIAGTFTDADVTLSSHCPQSLSASRRPHHWYQGWDCALRTVFEIQFLASCLGCIHLFGGFIVMKAPDWFKTKNSLWIEGFYLVFQLAI